ncbi:Atxe2 family lasso peptide isopeptidase [Sphingobium sp. BHU LFT2]|uniref:Atxe2 family lasso peptide isopeptidase n=1 Tax=Sphingobium sp. BHU LFT2 TaxID=2807634 RepID=UPI001BE6A7B7|nr:Atxe2 family lasso peptide isopeptidase [Sphingobium sp. BHU LFT2]MBT2246649.1 Atxe2 family lasso peptide isopeptidase [Sphingobium sp. BHU LFT2]
MLPLLALALAAAASNPTSASDCKAALQIKSPGPSHSLSAGDLIETLNMGSIPDLDVDPMFSVSPDGQSIAVSVARANIASNEFCSGIYVIAPGSSPRLIDSGAGAAFWRFDDYYGMTGFPSGFPKVITPHWSPDGKHLAFLKYVDGRLQLWCWDGSRSKMTATFDDDIVDFRFDGGGLSVIAKVRDDASASDALDQESLSGYHFDERWFPYGRNRPFSRGPAPYSFAAINIVTGEHRLAEPTQALIFSTSGAPSRAHRKAATLAVDADGVSRLALTDGTAQIVCADSRCTDVEGQAWIAGDAVRYVRREGWGRSLTGIYEWQPARKSVRKIMQTSDLLMNCGPLGTDIICAREKSVAPRYLDRIDPESGRSQVIFNPNPEFDSLALGHAERLQWKNDRDLECYGDLVYPPDYRAGQRYPLIVVQYQSRGFLRGGTGDEYPIQLLAQAGYLVLSIQRPPAPLRDQKIDPHERERRQLDGFMERRSILSAIETKVQQLISAGLVDPARIGITGLSDGVSTVQFAALHSRLFKVAAISSCCWEGSQTWLLGPAIQAEYEKRGWPASPADNPALWEGLSWARNANRIPFPVLAQMSDDEYLSGLEALTALRRAGKPVDLYVFPDEHHVKRQPAHRAAIYRRAIDWFNFWLLDKLPVGEGQAAQEADRWQQMRKSWNQREAKPGA